MLNVVDENLPHTNNYKLSHQNFNRSNFYTTLLVFTRSLGLYIYGVSAAALDDSRYLGRHPHTYISLIQLILIRCTDPKLITKRAPQHSR
ncbi:hypothetical protein E4T56_gene15335 [Termitomyces sp. T112]|nr:hypothetical protein E4T56_gene15335 [Termitomyces sp. T112]